MSDTPVTPVAAPAAPAVAPAPTPAPATGQNLIPVKGTRPILDPGDASPLGHPAGATPAPVPPGAIDETAADPSKLIS